MDIFVWRKKCLNLVCRISCENEKKFVCGSQMTKFNSNRNFVTEKFSVILDRELHILPFGEGFSTANFIYL